MFLSHLLRSLPVLPALLACAPQPATVDGSWSGEDHTGSQVTLTFGPERVFEVIGASGKGLALPEGALLEYEVLTEVDPDQLYLRVFQGDSLLAKVPFAIVVQIEY